MTSRTTSGSETNTVASTMPGRAKMTWKPLRSRKPPNQPYLP